MAKIDCVICERPLNHHKAKKCLYHQKRESEQHTELKYSYTYSGSV